MAVVERGFMKGPDFRAGKPRPLHWILLMMSTFVFSASLTILYHGMRGVLREGGFVASGGPYAIAHPAPDWAWIVALSAALLVPTIFTAFFAGSRTGGPKLMVLSWSAIFVSLGWNFLEFGLGLGMGGGLVWGWIVCAALFIPMGILPLLFIARWFIRSLGSPERSESCESPSPDERSGHPSARVSLTLQALFCGAGIWFGIYVFHGLPKG